VLARFFEAEDAVLVPGAGTGAIRSALIACLSPGARVLVHDFPVYATTAVTFRAMGLEVAACDLNDPAALAAALGTLPDLVHLQHSRQRLDDSWDAASVIAAVRDAAPAATILVDDNYAALQVPEIGIQLGADLSAFSLFKLLGEPGVGCVAGHRTLVDRIRADNYSGGTKIQGPVAVASLKGLVAAPVMQAIQAEVVDEVAARLEAGEVPGVARAHVANHQERGVLVELREPVAAQVVETAPRFGAAPYPVGSHSKVEVSAMVYRVSRAMLEADPELATRMIRINPFRAGPDTIIRVLQETMAAIAAGRDA
jgi:hypothetical protein